MDIGDLLKEATYYISQNYFQLPVEGAEDPIYRERVYCYELYHQLRVCWPDQGPQLAGEVDKNGHPVIKHIEALDKVKPDFLVHDPGNMDGNHTVIEVKPINATLEGIKKDLKTITAFRRFAGYKKGIYLFYGEGEIEDILRKIRSVVGDDPDDEIDLDYVELWWHQSVGKEAYKVN